MDQKIWQYKVGFGKCVDFERGSSKHKEDLLPIGLSQLAIINCFKEEEKTLNDLHQLRHLNILNMIKHSLTIYRFIKLYTFIVSYIYESFHSAYWIYGIFWRIVLKLAAGWNIERCLKMSLLMGIWHGIALVQLGRRKKVQLPQLHVHYHCTLFLCTCNNGKSAKVFFIVV